MAPSTYSSTQTTQMTSASSPCAPGFLTITFDDIINASSVQGAVPTTYRCFNWVNGWYANVSGFAVTNGFRRALVSGAYIVLNRNGTSMNITRTNSSFHVHSFVASAAYQDPLHLLLKGIQGSSTLAYQQDLLVNTSYARTITLNWYNLTTLNYQTYSYNNASGTNSTGLGQQFSMDNLNVTLT
ncbi:unnamed protein product [Adineta ricciae]|uniref:Uncharacterized protein n=1 Tax=Adineta ricciae TaxID=249248 RepID=A0A816A466_ADIRI|nr:unnamed protein product [Adineta ricciae]CAF1590858.1 unnamed protein product [Adineta ricciae]